MDELRPVARPAAMVIMASNFDDVGASINGKTVRESLRQSRRNNLIFDCLEDALRAHGKPEIFNSDQGSQFTSAAFTSVLEREGIVISMDGRGRVFDNIFVERLWRNVKYEDVYLKGYATMGELMVGLAAYFAFYNGERPHQSLGQQTPDVVHETGIGGGAMIVDKFGDAGEQSPVPLRSTGDCSPAEARSEATATTQATAQPGQRRPAANEVQCAA